LPLRFSLGTDVLVAWLPAAKAVAHGEARRFPLAPWDGSNQWPALVAALGEALPHDAAKHDGCVSILPPLAQLRTVESPTRDASRVRRHLADGAAAYFFAARQPQVVAAKRVGRHGSTGSRFVAAATPAALFDAIVAAFKTYGVTHVVLLPAHEAWQRSVRRREAASIDHNGVRYAFASGESLAGVRRHPVAGANSDLAEARAAEYAAPAAQLQFRHALEYRRAENRVRRFLQLSLGVAAACLVLTAALRLLDVRRELAAVSDARAALAPQLQAALRDRDTLFALERDIAAIRAREGTTASWTRAFETIARALPATATLMALRGQADTLIIEGAAPNAGAVFEAVQRAAGVASVRSVAPVRQAFDSTRGPFELFSLALTLSTKSDSAQ